MKTHHLFCCLHLIVEILVGGGGPPWLGSSSPPWSFAYPPRGFLSIALSWTPINRCPGSPHPVVQESRNNVRPWTHVCGTFRSHPNQHSGLGGRIVHYFAYLLGMPKSRMSSRGCHLGRQAFGHVCWEPFLIMLSSCLALLQAHPTGYFFPWPTQPVFLGQQ